MYVEDIIAACRKVMNGDEEALQQLGLDNVSYPLPKPIDTSLDRLQVNYTCALNIAVAARELQFSLIEDQCKIAMRLMQTIAKDRGMHLQHNVDGQDVAEVMLALIDEEQQRLQAMHPEKSDIAGSDSDAEEQQGEANDVTPLPPAAVTKPPDVSPAERSHRWEDGGTQVPMYLKEVRRDRDANWTTSATHTQDPGSASAG